MKKGFISWIIFLLVGSVCANDVEQKIPVPGYQPECDRIQEFIRAAPIAAIEVFPTIVRTPNGTDYFVEPRRQVVEFINENGLGCAVENAAVIDPGELKGRAQFGMFQNDLAVLGGQIKALALNTDYCLVMEILIPPSRQNQMSVFGIHCFVMDSQGQNVFSFLLNSHHQLFVDADMTADDVSEQSRLELIEKATTVGMLALQMRLETDAAQD